MTPYQTNQLIDETLGGVFGEAELEANAEVQEDPDPLSNTSGRGCTAEFRSLIKAAKAKMEARAEAEWADRWEIMLDNWRREGRERYAWKQAKLGRTVRGYRRHVHVTPDHPETYEDRLRREHRDRERTYRGKDEDTVRPYNDLSFFDDVEKAEYKRELNRLDKQQSRRRKKDAEAALTREPMDLERLAAELKVTEAASKEARQAEIDSIIERILAKRAAPSALVE